jgi:hypothetical protein
MASNKNKLISDYYDDFKFIGFQCFLRIFFFIYLLLSLYNEVDNLKRSENEEENKKKSKTDKEIDKKKKIQSTHSRVPETSSPI